MQHDIKLYGIAKESIVDGPGLRYVIFAQGCPHRCEGCHNPESHSFEGGKPYDTSKIIADIQKNPLLSGITLSGGEPFCSVEVLLPIAQAAKDMGLNVWAYSGYTFEELQQKARTHTLTAQLLSLCDVLVDGRFVLSQRSLRLKFRGSKNQRILDIPKSLKAGTPVLLEDF